MRKRQPPESLHEMVLECCNHVRVRAEQSRVLNIREVIEHAIVGAYLQGAYDALLRQREAAPEAGGGEG